MIALKPMFVPARGFEKVTSRYRPVPRTQHIEKAHSRNAVPRHPAPFSTLEALRAPEKDSRVNSAASPASSAESEMVALLKDQVENLQNLLTRVSREGVKDQVQAAAEASEKIERLRGEAKLLQLQSKHDIEKIKTEKDKIINELKIRQARDGIDFLLKNRTISARGAIEWAEREIRRLLFPAENPDRHQLWSYAINVDSNLNQPLNDLGWDKSIAARQMVNLYRKISEHIHDKFSPKMTATRPVIILEEGTGDGFLTAAEAGAIKALCHLFSLSYDAYTRDAKNGEIQKGPEIFRAMSDGAIQQATIDFYAQAEMDAAKAIKHRENKKQHEGAKRKKGR